MRRRRGIKQAEVSRARSALAILNTAMDGLEIALREISKLNRLPPIPGEIGGWPSEAAAKGDIQAAIQEIEEMIRWWDQHMRTARYRKKARPVRALSANTTRAVAFWRDFSRRFPHRDIERHIRNLEADRVDWFRNAGLVKIAVADACRVGRIGFNQEKYDEGISWATSLLRRHGIPPGTMQN